VVCRPTDLFYSSAKNKDTAKECARVCVCEREREAVRGRGEIKTREKDVKNTCVTGHDDDDDGADEAICPDRTSSNLLLVRVESECASLYNIIII